jgi:hypothetical protein
VKNRRRIPAAQAAVSVLVVVIARSAGEEPYPIFADDVVLRPGNGTFIAARDVPLLP